MDVIARLPDCDVQAADAISAYTQVKLEDAPRLLKIHKSECLDVWIRLPRHKWPKSWANIGDPVVLLERFFLWTPTRRPFFGKKSSRKFCWSVDVNKYRIGNVFLFTGNKCYSYRKTWTTQKWMERSSIWLPRGRNWCKTLILTNQIHFLITYTWGVLHVNANRMKFSLNSIQRCLNHEFLLEQLKSYQVGKSLTQRPSRCPTAWKDMLENALSDTVSWPTKKMSNFTKFRVSAWMIIQFKKEELESVGELSQVSSQIVLKCLYLAQIGRLDILWSVNELARAVTKWTKSCDKRLARLISYFHHTSEFRQYCHVGNTAQQCRLGLFQHSDFAGDLEDSKSTSVRVLCIYGSHTFVTIS